VLCAAATAYANITLETVTVGDPGNAADPGTGSGTVSYTYLIGKYEVSNAEYAAFLNAVDQSGINPNAIYNGNMNSDASNGGITFTAGSASGSKYAAKTGFENKPVVYVNIYDAMRFANWLNNGQGGADTETGAYTLSSPGPRNSGATVFVTSEAEWYKAAYFDPTKGETNYWLYPTQSDGAPGAAAPNSSANQANYSFAVGAVTNGGAYSGSASHYGTFDQGGNVWEWNDEILLGSPRTLLGGSWNASTWHLESSYPYNFPYPGMEINTIGFRIAIVPEPSSIALLATAAVGLGARRKRPARAER
jgi:formylglycine-generating enzyme required for sulfatase activity